MRAVGIVRRQRRHGQSLQHCAQDGSMENLPTGKTAGHVALDAGDGFLMEVGGGGGFWNPLSAIQRGFSLT